VYRYAIFVSGMLQTISTGFHAACMALRRQGDGVMLKMIGWHLYTQQFL